MSIARCDGFALSFAGHIITHNPQPVQSSGATCTVYSPRRSVPLNGTCLKVAGALASASCGYTLTRIAAWGQTSAHLLHWMHKDASHTGMSAAMLRRSHCAVPVGHVPSTGNALTGRRSPLLASITAVTRLMKSGASSGTDAGWYLEAVGDAGTAT